MPRGAVEGLGNGELRGVRLCGLRGRRALLIASSYIPSLWVFSRRHPTGADRIFQQLEGLLGKWRLPGSGRCLWFGVVDMGRCLEPPL